MQQFVIGEMLPPKLFVLCTYLQILAVSYKFNWVILSLKAHNLIRNLVFLSPRSCTSPTDITSFTIPGGSCRGNYSAYPGAGDASSQEEA